MAMDYTNSYATIVKYDVNDDGTLMVYGKATDDTLDLDSQICDPAWLDTAMPAWFKSGGNIREMHGPSAAGVAKEYESKSDGHYIGVHVVDPIAVKKVETRVYQGFSIGIKSPRVVRDTKAANGRIIDGQIIEVSLVDRPANPSAKLILAKAVEGESSLVQVEELHEYKAPSPSDVAKMVQKGSKMETIEQIMELAKSLTSDQILELTKKLNKESAEHESSEGHSGSGAEHELSEEKAVAPADADREEAVGEKMCDKCDKAVGECTCADKSAEAEAPVEAPVVEETPAPVAEEVPAPVVEETPAVAEATEQVSEVEPSDATSIEDVVEKAVKSAMESVKAEIDALRADKEAAVEKSVKLESELATALSKSVAGGPKRTATSTGAVSNEYLVKALAYKAKADATTDPVLAKGYRALYAEFSAKAEGKSVENK